MLVLHPFAKDVCFQRPQLRGLACCEPSLILSLTCPTTEMSSSAAPTLQALHDLGFTALC